MKVLVSWLAYNNDFSDGEVNSNGPTYQFHQNFFQHDLHIILSSAKSEDLRLEKLLNKIRLDFTNHSVEEKYMNVTNVIDLEDILFKVKKLLREYAQDEIDIFFSPGTSIMQLSWYICHTTLGLNTNLLQTWRDRKKEAPSLTSIRLEKTQVPQTYLAYQSQQQNADYFDDEDYLITESIRPAYENARKIAQTENVTTLIIGDTGTGKEHLAKFIHQHSDRRNQPFIPINCSAFHDQLLESRLFGHKKGSFTGADKDMPGLFVEAKKGTIFLDEIGDISSYMQQSLLRVLQEKEISPVGGKPQKIDVRIIAATNRNLIKRCRDGEFRWDLYYRLTEAELELPSLQERGQQEKKNLIEHFIKKQKSKLKKAKAIKLNAEVRQMLMNYSFPGNIRELENLITRMYIFAEEEEEVKVNLLPRRILANEDEGSLAWSEVEKRHIHKVLKLYHGNQRQSALTLGYAINTLKSKMKKYDIDSSVVV